MMTEWTDPMMHTHDDGMEHLNEGGDVQHTHDDPLHDNRKLFLR